MVMGLAVAGGVVCLLLLVVLVLFLVRRRREADRKKQLRKEELEEMIPEVEKRAKKDENFCKKGISELKQTPSLILQIKS